MQIVAGGVRGSFPVCGAQFSAYGGATTSILVRGDRGETVFLDLGSGLRHVVSTLSADDPRQALVLMTHYHLDHVMGWPSLGRIPGPPMKLVFAAPRMDGREIGAVLPGFMTRPFWPVMPEQTARSVTYRTLLDRVSAPLRWGGLRIRWTAVHHSGGSTAYRIEEPDTGASVAMVTDIEWPASSEEEKNGLRRLLSEPEPVRLLLFDGHFGPRSYEAHRGWGHSRWTDAVDLARDLGIPQTRVLHHAPSKTDAALDRLELAVRRTHSGTRLLRAGARIRLS